MVAHLIFFSDFVTFTFGGHDMHQYRTAVVMGLFKGGNQFGEVVAVYRSHLREPKFFEYRAHFRDR